jgi:hypothetical protein
VKLATSEPLVREAMDLFDGSLVNVERVKKPETEKPQNQKDGSDQED